MMIQVCFSRQGEFQCKGSSVGAKHALSQGGEKVLGAHVSDPSFPLPHWAIRDWHIIQCILQ